MREFMMWLTYRKKNGPMNDIRRFDRPAALVSLILSRIHGGKAEMEDFLPFGRKEKEATLSDIIGEFGGVKVG